ncbi:CpaD family pilus assembly protein [Flavisphingomonas formosensis]|uniref:CpaD family pilus assembly protein n=1 Tax=Flavisphingomonas formosensis TaxID=861534 RepID=UPI0012F94FE5|nr:CpaD family pilus assembly lipoprotein [Sphingomonas formosensis]
MRRITLVSLLSLGASLGACGPVNRSMDSVHQPIVSRNDYMFDVVVDSGGALAPGEDRRLGGWFDSIRLGYGDRVAIDATGMSRGYAARNQVAQIAARYGLLVDTLPPAATPGVPTGALRIVVSRAAAGVPRCPDWDRVSQPEFAGSAMSNYGCAVNSNLAAMVANPEDLVHGQNGGGTSDGRTVNRALRVYRDAIPTAVKEIKKESTTSGGGQ